MRTHVTKEHNNQDTTNTCKDNTGLSCRPQVDHSINSQPVFVVKIAIENLCDEVLFLKESIAMGKGWVCGPSIGSKERIAGSFKNFQNLEPK